jgi:hypothetical protein
VRHSVLVEAHFLKGARSLTDGACGLAHVTGERACKVIDGLGRWLLLSVRREHPSDECLHLGYGLMAERDVSLMS